MNNQPNLHPVVWTNEKIGQFHNNVDLLIKNGKMANNYFSYKSGIALLNFFNKMQRFNEKSILDYGCGPGHFINLLLTRFKPKVVYGFDLSDESIKICNERNATIQRYGGGRSGLECKYESDMFDVILLIEVVEHVDDNTLSYIFQQCYRMLKKNGVLLISTPNKEVLEESIQVCPDCGCYFHSVQHVRNWSGSSLSKYLAKENFCDIKFYETTLFSDKTFFKKVLSKIVVFLMHILKMPQKNLIVRCKKNE